MVALNLSTSGACIMFSMFTAVGSAVLGLPPPGEGGVGIVFAEELHALRIEVAAIAPHEFQAQIQSGTHAGSRDAVCAIEDNPLCHRRRTDRLQDFEHLPMTRGFAALEQPRRTQHERSRANAADELGFSRRDF